MTYSDIESYRIRIDKLNWKNFIKIILLNFKIFNKD